MITDCTAVILAGGDSRRMGQDKAMLPLGGKTLLQHVTDSVAQVFPQVIVSVRQPRTGLDLPQVCDAFPDGGPLAGLAAALESIETPWLFAVGCDMPFLAPAVIEALARQRAGHQAVVPVVQGHPQPLAAFYARECIEAMRDIQAGGGKRSLRALLERLDVCYVDEAQLREYDPQLRSFFDLDTPADVAAVSNGVS
ncbi:MAG: molybdenum cofactor guanylyltransferase [Gallionella sp.]|nr:molybdenum cofactor guanylyltransferase [Gallionella sp.]MCK9355232.1 molybdenum cofactor guanylyltransferase [Gallionella sp.]